MFKKHKIRRKIHECSVLLASLTLGIGVLMLILLLIFPNGILKLEKLLVVLMRISVVVLPVSGVIFVITLKNKRGG